jgi:hypothetical protein
MNDTTKFKFQFTGEDVFIVADGVRIARRQDEAWVALEPGWEVEMSPDYETISITYNPPRQ